MGRSRSRSHAGRGPTRADPPPLPPVPPARTLREIFRLCTNDPRYGLAAIVLFLGLSLLGLDGPVLPWLWADLVDGTGNPYLPAVGIVAGLLVTLPLPYYTHVWFPQWWVRQMLRIGLRLVHGQTGPRRVSSHTPAEVVAQGGDTERVVQLADNVLDQAVALVLVVAMTAVTGSVVPGLFFLGTMVVSGLAATLFGPKLERAARATVAARAAFATALVSVALGGADGEARRRDHGGAGATWRAWTCCAATGSGGRSRCRCGRAPPRRWPAGCCRSGPGRST